MPSTWRTLWGNAFHGLWVTWYNEPSASGDPTLVMKFQVNYYMKKVVACDGGAASTCTTPYGTPDVDVAGGSNGDWFSTDVSTDFLIYIAWAAPESASTECTVCYDSVDAKVRLDVNYDDTGYHLWNAYWAPRYSDATTNLTGCCDNTASCSTCGGSPTASDANGSCDKSWDAATNNDTKFDGLPTVEYAYSAYSGSDLDNVNCYKESYYRDPAVNTAGSAYGGMCREVWELQAPGSACVRFEGSLERLFDTGDSTADIVLTYREYEMHAQIGMQGGDLDANTYNGQLGIQTVDFANFYADEPTSALGLGTSCAFIAGSLLLSLY